MLRVVKRLSDRPGAVLAALLACAGVIGAPAVAQSDLASSVRAAPLIPGSIDETRRVILRGNTRPEALRAAFDRGAVDDSFPLNGMQLQLKRSPMHEARAESLADELQKASSPQFHQWLTPAEYAEQFGVAETDIATITAWLQSHGFAVQVSPSRMTIDFSGTAGQVREVFGTEIHALEVKGQRHIANVRDPSIPAALAPVIEGIVSLHDFRPRPMVVRKSQYSFPLSGVITGSEFFAMAPADLATIYQFNPLFAAGITGQGQTIALIDDSDVYHPDDWKKFRSKFGLDAYPGGSFKTVHPGGCTDPGVNADDFESIIDVEWASAAAPSADLQLATCEDTTTTFGVIIALQNLVNQTNVPSIISLSYSTCETLNGAAANAAQKAVSLQAVLEGVSLFVSAGDSGPDSCDQDAGFPAVSGISVNAYAATAYNVAVGGTDFGDVYAGTVTNYWSTTNDGIYGSAFGYVPEIPWNDTCASTLITNYLGLSTPYGAGGFCANVSTYFSASLAPYFIDALVAGSGGPSNCATGADDPDASLPGIAYPANGTCKGWKKPSWQNVVGNPNDGVRDLPDIAMFAGNGMWNHAYVFCDSDTANGGAPCVGAPSNWSLAGGTSFGAPIIAGMQALVNQIWGGRQGNPNPVYYAIAQVEYGAKGNQSCNSTAPGGPAHFCAFNDVTIGDNDVDCIGPYNCYDSDASTGAIGVLSTSDSAYHPAFKAGVGWDFATGIGSVNATLLVLSPIWGVGAGP
ncbi:MAG: protease pro-enzyme activation domain-containing protein [Steroidobacteraceae bacterium]|jgi:subtilase family serine protease